MIGLRHQLLDGVATGHRPPARGTWREPTKPRATGLASGLVAGTWVATAMGWRPAEAIALGDLVLTFDRGMQPVGQITRGLHWDMATACPDPLLPLAVPAGALGNMEAMTLLPEQSVLVESDTADALFGDPFTLIAAAALDGFRGIGRVRAQASLEVIQLRFGADEVVFAGYGALVHCPGTQMIDAARVQPRYRSLPASRTAKLVRCLREEDATAGAAAPRPEFSRPGEPASA